MKKNQLNRRQRMLCGFLVLLLSLCSCAALPNGEATGRSKIKQDAETLMYAVQNEEYDPIVELFSPYVKTKYPNLKDDIIDLMDYIDGDIVSYGHMVFDSMGGSSTEEGWVEKKLEGTIYDIVTSNNKTYAIIFGGYYINKEEPDKVGTRYISIFNVSDGNIQVHNGKSIYYE